MPITDFENNSENKLKLELIKNKLRGSLYVAINKELLVEAILGKAKKDIAFLTSNLITTLKAVGYSQAFLYKKTQETFYDFNNQVESFEIVKYFLDTLDLKAKKYEVLFKASNIYLEIQSSCKSFNLEILTNFPNRFIDPTVKFSEKKINNDIYILCGGIEARDPIKARHFAERLTDKIANLFIFFHHKQKPKILREALVIETETGEIFKVTEQTSPMVKGFDLKPKKAAIKLNEVLKGFGLVKDSFERIDKAIDLHGIAVDNKNVENQLLNLWISFETLIQGNDKKGKVHQVTDCIMPILKSTYVRILLDDAVKSLSMWNSIKLKSFLSRITVGENVSEKCYALILAEDYESLRSELVTQLDEYPLLRNRIFELNKSLYKGNKILETISDHEKKVIWQLRRIYRTRNFIVHKGGTLINVDILVENSHNYFDVFINKLYQLAINGRQINTIEQGIKATELEWVKKEKYLMKNKEVKLTSSNYLNFI